jgi:hypothetical protein
MKEIQLNQGLITLIDDEDYEKFAHLKWQASKHRYTWYVKYRYQHNKEITHISLHRVIMNAPKGIEVDHVDGNGLDNRKKNLRLATHIENHHNQKPQQSCSSQYKGVSLDKHSNKWTARISNNGISHFLGRFQLEEEAALAYNEAAMKYHQEFAYLNILPRSSNGKTESC